MFTGLVECMGTFNSVYDNKLTIYSPNDYLIDAKIGDSIAINGTCLTITDLCGFGNCTFSVEVTPETLKCTCLGQLKKGDKVNLERALLPSTRMGGHFVQGHVDCCVKIIKREEEGNSMWFTFKVAEEHSKYIIEKGFVCLDGISLTACRVGLSEFSIMMIPHTQENVALFAKQIGDLVNLEVDMLSKMVERHNMFKLGNISNLPNTVRLDDTKAFKEVFEKHNK